MAWRKGLREKEREFVSQVIEETPDWAKERRVEFLRDEILKISKQIIKLDDFIEPWKKIFPEMDPLWLDDLRKKRKKHKQEIDIFENPVEHHQGTRYSEEMIQRARDVSVVELLPGHWEDVGGGRQKTCCPFHEEKTASFMVFDDNHWHCFGCAAHGMNAVDFIMKQNQTNFYEAVSFLTGGI